MRTLFLWGFLFLSSHLFGSTQQVNDLLENAHLSDAHFQQLDSLLHLSNFYDDDFAKEAYQKSIDKAVAQKAWSWAGQYEKSLMNIHFNLYEYPLAIQHGLQSEMYFEKAGDDIAKAHLFGTLRAVYAESYQYQKGFDICYEALNIFEKANDVPGQAMILEDIGSMFIHQKKYREAIDHLFQSLALVKDTDDGKQIGQNYVKLAVTYEKMGTLDSALYLMTKSLPYCDYHEGFIRTEHLACRYMLRADIYKSMGNWEKVIEDCLQAFEYIEEINYTPLIHSVNNVLGEAYYHQGAFEKALEYFQLTQQYLDENDIDIPYHFNTPIEQNLSKAYAAVHQYDKAYLHATNHAIIMDSIYHLENTKQINELRTRYETEKKEIFISKLKVESLARQKMTLLYGLLFFTLFLLVLGGLWGRLLLIRKSKNLIEIEKERAEQSEKYKEQFLANMSHEIRTPMHAISGMTKILKRNQHASDQEVYLNAIDQSSNNLLVILNDILDLSKIEAGKIRLESIPMSPTTVVENIMDVLKFKAEDKGLYLTSEIAEDIPPLIVSDPNRLNQILTNLAGNAIKFTERGIVKIKLRKVEENGKAMLQFEINDTGIGIPTDQLERVFKSFEQGDKTLGKKHGGTGLGLHISKELIELQGGKIWVESQVNQGSRFYFTLPLIIGEGVLKDQATLSEERLKTMGTEISGLRILLAEDNDFNALVATDDLSYYIPDIKIDHVENGLDALVYFQKEKYDLVLMDMQMPEMNGYEASERIRVLEKELDTRIPIIAMTASLLKTEIQQCYEAGMNNYIPKPYKTEELIGRIYEEVKR